MGIHLSDDRGRPQPSHYNHRLPDLRRCLHLIQVRSGSFKRSNLLIPNLYHLTNPKEPKTKALILTFLSLLSLLLILPIYWMIMSSFTELSGAITTSFFPTTPTLRNYQLLSTFPVLRWILNSFIVAISSMLLTTLITVMAGYGFEKFNWPFKELVFWAFLISIMLPFNSIVIPIYILMKNLHLLDTYAGLILPGLLSPVLIFWFRQFMKRFPDELLSAADIDGCSNLRKFFQIIIPLSKPAIATIMIFTFMGGWMGFLWPLIITKSLNMRTLLVGVAEVVNRVHQFGRIDFGLSMAGAVVAFIPTLIIFLLFQKHFIKGLYSGGITQ